MSLRRHLTFANVAAGLALVIAVGGGGVAVAASVPKNSVSTYSIVNGGVKNVDLGPNSVTGDKVKPDSLTGSDIHEGTLKLPKPANFSSKVTDDDFSVSTAPSSDPQIDLYFTADYAGFARVTAEASVAGSEGGGYLYVTMLVDGVVVRDAYWNVPPAGGFISQALTITKGLKPGVHRVSLKVAYENQATTTLYLPQMHATLTPSGVAGTVVVD